MRERSSTFDLSLDFGRGSGRLCLTGQVSAGGSQDQIAGLSVVLAAGSETLARTTTDQFGEFHIECEFPEDVSLEIRLGERAWVLVPLGKAGSKGDEGGPFSRRASGN